MRKGRRWFLHRGVLVAGLVVVIVGAMLAPSIGGSFLTAKKAKKTFLKKSAAVTTKAVTSTTLPALSTNAQVPTDIPGATTSITVPKGQKALLVVTFSGPSLCTNATSGFNCPLLVTVDGATGNPVPDPTGYLWDTTVQPANSANRSLSLTVSKPVDAGSHTVAVRYGGSAVAGTQFTLRSWHLLVQAVPQ